MQIKRALISVSDKSGIIEFAGELHRMGVEILSTGGTATLISEAGIPVQLVSDYTDFPEILDGRVKTLHPKIHGALLARRGKKSHIEQIAQSEIKLIDILVVNLYPFEEVTRKEDVSMDEALENIDIGGPSMLRSAAKNYPDVVVVTDPEDYQPLLREIKQSGQVSMETRGALALKVFEKTAQYDAAISNYLRSSLLSPHSSLSLFPDRLTLTFRKIQSLRYGENPHQRAAFYRESNADGETIARAKKLHGKELSYNNILDLDTALKVVRDFEEICVVIIKHNNPCGIACGKTLLEAYNRARECDPVSAFGSVIGVNRKVDKDIAEEINKTFVEALIAPDFSKEALEILKRKEAIRLLAVSSVSSPSIPAELDFRKVGGGLLLQDADQLEEAPKIRTVTEREPTKDELRALFFAWKVVKHIKSNAIVFTTDVQTVGIGAGQMSRVDSCKIAAMKARMPLKGTVVASDAFFPYRDGIDEIARAGASAIIQPGGSQRDAEVIAACNEYRIAMVFTGTRHFRH